MLKNISVYKVSLVVIFVGGILFLGIWNKYASSENSADGTLNDIPVKELIKFAEVYTLLKNTYIEEIEDKTMIENAIKGMLTNLDPHSAYYDPVRHKDFEESTSGKFAGLGMHVEMSEDGFVRVISPIDDTPAKRVGIKSGDLVIRIGDKPVKGMTLSEAVSLMRGKVGTKVTLTLFRIGTAKTFKKEIERDIIKTTSVRKRFLEDNIGYVRISSFQQPTTKDLIKAIKELDEDKNNSLDSLVLDLRSNPGGQLNAAVGVADAFLDGGNVVSIKGRDQIIKRQRKAKRGDVLNGRPLVVLINEGSASASEIVAGALQAHKRAIIVGRPSFGKATVQTSVRLPDQSSVKFTTANYYTPDDKSIQGEGIIPDIRVEPLSIKSLDNELEADKEEDLAQAIDNPEKTKALVEELGEDALKEEKPVVEAPLYERDYELYAATQIIRTMLLNK